MVRVLPLAQDRCMVRDGGAWQDLVTFWEGVPATLHGFHHSTVEFAPGLLHIWAEGSAKAFLQHVQQGLANSLQNKQGSVKLSTRGQCAAPSLTSPPPWISPTAGQWLLLQERGQATPLPFYYPVLALTPHPG